MTASNSTTLSRVRIGDFLVQEGLLTPAQVLLVLEHAERTGLRFGEASIDSGILTEEQLKEVFGPLFWVDYFHLEPEYFPKSTQSWISLEACLRLGIVPLGLKESGGFLSTRRILNVGMLHPTEEAIAQLKTELKDVIQKNEITELRPFLVLADPLIRVLEKNYQFDLHQFRNERTEAMKTVESTLALFLEV